MKISRFFDRFREKQEPVRWEPEYLTPLPAPTDGDYPLRTKQEEALYRALCRRGSHILLYGPGGTGKTHMARKLFYRLSREYPRLAWVEYGTGIRRSMSRSTETIGGNPDQWFEQFIQRLEEQEQDTILFVDDAKEEAVDDAALAQITGMGITILMTSRCPEISPYETWKLEPLTDSECADLFYANYPKDPQKRYRRTVLTLADRLERNAFAMLLLANVAGAPTNLPRIAQRLRDGDLMDHIGQMMECSELTAEEEQLLRCLALTNSGELDEGLVRWLEFPDSDVKALVRKGWLVRNRETECLVLHDLVREYCNRETPDRRTVERFIQGALGEEFNRGAVDHAPAAFKGRVLAFQVRALELMEQYWDSEEDLAAASNTVGNGFSSFGDYRRSLEFHQKALEIREKVLPSDHSELATSYNNLGSTYGNLGDHAKALEFLQRALKIREKVLPPDHLDLAISYNNVGYTYGNLGDRAKALEFNQKALEIREKVLPPDDPTLAISYGNVGTTYGGLGDHAKALEYQRKALEIHEKVLPPDHPDLATSYNNVGSTYGNLGDYAKALEFFRKDLEICERVLPPDHSDLATSYNNLGLAYGKLGDWDKTLEYCRRALNIWERVLSRNDPLIAASCSNIACTYAEQQQYETALGWMGRAVEIAEYALPEDHPSRKAYREYFEYLKQQC